MYAIYIYIYMYIRIHASSLTAASLSSFMAERQPYILTNTYMIQKHRHTHTYTHTDIHIYTCIHIHTASSLTAASLSSFMARRHSLVCASPTEAMAIKDLIAASRTCHVCMYVCMHVCVHVCMYDCMYVCMYVCMHVCGNKLPCLLCA